MAEDKNKSLKERKALLQAEYDFTQKILSAAQTTKILSEQATQSKAELLSQLAQEGDLKTKISTIDDSIEEMLKEQVEKGEEINQHYIDQLEAMKKLLQSKEKEKNLEAEIGGHYESANDELITSLGTMGDMLKAGTAVAAAMALFKGLTEQISAAFENTLGFAAELNTELGISGDESMRMGFQNLAPSAIFSRFSIEQLNTATKDFAETMGTTAGLTNNLRNSMAEMSAMGLEGAQSAKLAQSFDSASGDAQQLTTEIKNMAKDAGVLASVTFKDLASQQRLLVGMTENEIKLLAKKTIEINKQGLALSDMKDIADSMMDIESTMKAQSKARVMLQGKLTQEQISGMTAMNAAALEYQRTGDETALLDTLKQTNMSAQQFKKLGPRGQEIYAQSIGMTADKLAEVIQKQEQAQKIEEGSVFGKAAAGALELWERIPGGLKEATTGLIAYIAQMAILNTMQGRGTGLGNLNPFKKKGGGGGVPGMDATQDAGGQAGQAAQGSGGGLKSLAEGLREMGDAKVLAGVGVVALAGPAFIIALPAIPFLLFMGKIKLKALEENFGGLGRGLAQVPQGALGALTMMLVGPALALGTLAIPFLLFMSIPGIGPLMSANFTALAAGLAAFGNPATAIFVLIGIGLMAALGVAMIPFAYALSLLTPLLEAFGTIVVNVMAAIPPIIEAIANGFVTMFTALTPENVMGMMLLGPALLSASVGMIAFSAALAVGGIASFFGGGVVDQIKELSEVGPGVAEAGRGLAEVATHIGVISLAMAGLGSLVTPLYALAGGLYSISGGLVTVAAAGLLAIPIFGALAGLAALAPALVGLGEFFGMGGDSESSDSSGSDGNAELLEEIKGLRSDIKAQPIVLNIDGKAIQKITRVQSRQGVSTRGFN